MTVVVVVFNYCSALVVVVDLISRLTDSRASQLVGQLLKLLFMLSLQLNYNSLKSD